MNITLSSHFTGTDVTQFLLVIDFDGFSLRDCNPKSMALMNSV